jgi:hypothetical protein
MVLAIVRDGEVIRFSEADAEELRAGDRVIELKTHRH